MRWLETNGLSHSCRRSLSTRQAHSEIISETGYGDLQPNKELRGALKTVLKHGHCADEGHFQRLKAAGLVADETRNAARMRCQLYEIYFKDRL